MKHKFSAMTLALSLVVASGCTTLISEDSITDDARSRHSAELERWKADMDAPRDQRVRITDDPLAGERIEFEKHGWLRKKKVTLNIAKGASGVTAHTLAQMLKDNGIQVMSSLPLHSYQYNGFGVRNIDAVTAMRLLFAPMGLDFTINDEDQYVVITPNKSRTFFVKLGERKAEYESGTISGNMGETGSGSGSSSSSSSEDGVAAGVETGLSTGVGRIRIEADFWANLEKELDKLLVQCVPTMTVTSAFGGAGGIPPFPGDSMSPSIMPAAAPSSSSEICKDEKIGNFAINPSTGAITVQAPHWILDGVGSYIETIRSDNAVTLVYEGLLISVSSTKEKSEGIDLQGFAQFASGKWGMSVSNNALGGVTVSGGIPTLNVDGIADTVVGAVKTVGNPAQVFLAYLEANANYSVKQKPRVAVTNGMPGEFGQYDTMYYTQIVQETTSGDTDGIVGTQNKLVPFKVGSLLRIVPYYDSSSGYVRSPITFTQSVQTGTYETNQYITAGNTIQSIPSVIPLIRDSNYAGEVLMKDGDMLIIGGQVSESSESVGSGLPGYNKKGNPISGFMGKKAHKDEVSTYYLALTLRVNK